MGSIVFLWHPRWLFLVLSTGSVYGKKAKIIVYLCHATRDGSFVESGLMIG